MPAAPSAARARAGLASARAMPAPLPAITEVAVIGAGFSGAGRRDPPARRGRATSWCSSARATIGGTWREQHVSRLRVRHPVAPLLLLLRAQPGLVAHLLAPSRRSPPTCAASPRRARDPRPHPHGCEVTGATWDEEAARWRVETSRGDRRGRACSSPAPGRSPRRAVPDVPGLDALRRARASTPREWDHGYDLAGKRVAVVGTGASRDPDRAGDRAAGRAPARAPAHAAVGDPAPRPRDRARASAGSTASVPAAAAARARRRSTPARELLVLGVRQAPGADAGCSSAPRAAHLRRPGRPIPRCARG